MKAILHCARTYWLALLFLTVNLALLAAFYERLPNLMPSFWNTHGEITGRIAKPMGPLLLPATHLLAVLFLIIVPSVDPGAMRVPATRRFYPLAVAIVSGFLAFATACVFGASLALIGNYLGKIPKNYVVGIRTPWTLSSDYVWERTHRFAAPLFVVGGLALLLHSMLQDEALNPAFVGTIMVVTFLAPYFHSYAVWKRSTSAPAS
jgi:uncharacterized membrane protein